MIFMDIHVGGKIPDEENLEIHGFSLLNIKIMIKILELGEIVLLCFLLIF